MTKEKEGAVWFGWRTLNVDEGGMPTPELTPWKASCFISFTHIIYVGEVVVDERF